MDGRILHDTELSYYACKGRRIQNHAEPCTETQSKSTKVTHYSVGHGDSLKSSATGTLNSKLSALFRQSVTSLVPDLREFLLGFPDERAE